MSGVFGIFIKNVFSFRKDKTLSHEFPDMLSKNRGGIEIDITGCDFCCKCREVCPADAIQPDRDGHLIQYDSFKCIVCGSCIRNCCNSCIIAVKDSYPPAVRRSSTILR